MFIYSLRAGTVRLIGVVCVALTVLITLIAFVPTYAISSQASASPDGQTYNYEKIKTAEDVVTFLSQFGWKASGSAVEVQTVTIPEEFDKVFAAYNEMQKAQGLNLSKYRGKEVTRYTLAIENYPSYEGTVYANVLVYRNRVVGGDVCSADVAGFVHGFEQSSK
ncbi:MAG: DUF4830 domain-containing protein [Clostridia bacterium]|nr:DUF4830 domain-containing protein [Clostridia bacterium]